MACAIALFDDGATSGGILSIDHLTMVNSAVTGNGATGTNGAEARGGGLYLTGADVHEIRGSTIADNAAAADRGRGGRRRDPAVGGAVSGSANGTVSGNTVSTTGSAISARGGGATLDAATLTNVTLAGNTASGNSEAGSSLFAPGAVLRNTIVAGDCVNAVAQATNSIDTGTSCGFAAGAGNQSGVDPRLGPLAAPTAA